MTTMVWPCKRNGISKPPRTNWSNQVLEGMMQDLAKNSKEKMWKDRRNLSHFIHTKIVIHKKLPYFNYAVHTTNDFI
jgi:hypothetical protein